MEVIKQIRKYSDKSFEMEDEDRCLINGCQELIACSVCGGCEEHHRNNLENGKCKIQELMEEEQ